MTDLIIGVVLGVFAGVYVSNPKARKWVSDHLFKKKAKPVEKEKPESKPWSWD